MCACECVYVSMSVCMCASECVNVCDWVCVCTCECESVCMCVCMSMTGECVNTQWRQSLGNTLIKGEHVSVTLKAGSR